MSTRTRNQSVAAPAVDETSNQTQAITETPIVTTEAPTLPASVRLFDELREVVRNGTPQDRANVTALGARRYDSGNSRPSNSGGRAAPIFYPYLFSKNIFPATVRTPQQKLDFIRAEMLAKQDDKKIILLAVDLSKLLTDAGMELPEHLTQAAIKDAILSKLANTEHNEVDEAADYAF
jgi:hypothetical protein